MIKGIEVCPPLKKKLRSRPGALLYQSIICLFFLFLSVLLLDCPLCCVVFLYTLSAVYLLFFDLPFCLVFRVSVLCFVSLSLISVSNSVLYLFCLVSVSSQFYSISIIVSSLSSHVIHLFSLSTQLNCFLAFISIS